MRKPRTPGGFVYFVQCGCEHGPIKVGHAVDPDRRLDHLQAGSPYPLRLISKLWSDDPADLERRLHAKFAPYRIRGEWFSDAILPAAREAGRLYLRTVIDALD